MPVLAYVCAKSLQLCPTLCDTWPMDHSPPGSSTRGILQARILEWSGCPPPVYLPVPGIKPTFLHLQHWQAGSLPLAPSGKPCPFWTSCQMDTHSRRAWLHSLGVTFSRLSHVVTVSALHCFCGWTIPHRVGRPRFVYLLSVWWHWACLSLHLQQWHTCPQTIRSGGAGPTVTKGHPLPVHKLPFSARLFLLIIFFHLKCSYCYSSFLLYLFYFFYYVKWGFSSNITLKYIVLHLPSQFSYSTIFG